MKSKEMVLTVKLHLIKSAKKEAWKQQQQQQDFNGI